MLWLQRLFAIAFSSVDFLHLKRRSHVNKYVINRTLLFVFTFFAICSFFAIFSIIFFSFSLSFCCRSSNFKRRLIVKYLNKERLRWIRLSYMFANMSINKLSLRELSFDAIIERLLLFLFFRISRTISSSYNRKLIDIQCFFVEVD